jgi:hypothetical protein
VRGRLAKRAHLVDNGASTRAGYLPGGFTTREPASNDVHLWVQPPILRNR